MSSTHADKLPTAHCRLAPNGKHRGQHTEWDFTGLDLRSRECHYPCTESTKKE